MLAGLLGASSVFQKHRWAGKGVSMRPVECGPQVLMAQQLGPQGDRCPEGGGEG